MDYFIIIKSQSESYFNCKFNENIVCHAMWTAPNYPHRNTQMVLHYWNNKTHDGDLIQ